MWSFDLITRFFANSESVWARIHVASSSSAQPASFFAKSATKGFASSSGYEAHEPLWMIARENKPALDFNVRCAQTDAAPADSPAIVTCFGSPPKAPILA